MKKYIIIAFSLVFALNLKAQDVSKVSNNLFKINILSPGLTFEKRITSNNTICLDGNIAYGFNYTTNNGFTNLFSPYIRGQFRNYYNFDKRIAKGKNTSNNSGNFLAFTTSYYLQPIGNKDLVNNLDGLTVGATWGMQRTYKSGFNINLNTGLGYNFSNLKDRTVVPIINFTVGWVLFSKQ
jgi:hypothetical protein